MIEASITAKVFTILNDFLFKYGETIFENTAQIFLTLFSAVYGCKVMWDIFYKSTFKKKYDLEDFLKPIVICSFLTTVLSTSSYVEEWIVRPLYDLSIGLATLTASLTTDLPKESGITGMLSLVDGKLNEVVFRPCNIIADTIGYKVHLWFGILIIQGLYIFVWFLFLALVIEAIFRFMTFYALSPLIICSFFFEQTKPIGMAGFRSLLHGILSLFLTGVAMGMTIAIIGTSQDLFFVDGKMNRDWIFGEQYFTLILIALVSISFHLKAPKISANLANIDDGPGAAAAVAGLGTMAVMSAKGAMGRMVGRAAGLGRRGASSLGKKGWNGREKDGKFGMKWAGKGTGKGLWKGAKYLGGGTINQTRSLYQQLTGK